MASELSQWATALWPAIADGRSVGRSIQLVGLGHKRALPLLEQLGYLHYQLQSCKQESEREQRLSALNGNHEDNDYGERSNQLFSAAYSQVAHFGLRSLDQWRLPFLIGIQIEKTPPIANPLGRTLSLLDDCSLS